eukprot:TRINITY_DN22894_c0_g1_i1.p1 TRINITY_DN22894_c0_g1~~TRINITY_DN22894_c0_g1_i1.p1  ORF type:complete len:367 (+),score=61.76 TRINITY_DN22894_c0_g1_i1:77-1177(+)
MANRRLALVYAVLLASVGAHGQRCITDDFSIIYNGQAYLTVSSVNGSTSVLGPMLVAGAAAFGSGASVTGPLTANGPLTVTGPTMFSNVFATAGLTLTGGNLRVEQGVSQFLSGATFSNVAPTFPAGIAGPVSFTGAVAAGAGLSVSGGSLQVSSGVASFSSGATFSGVAPTFPAGIAGNVTFSGSASFGGVVTAPSISASSATFSGTMSANTCDCASWSVSTTPPPLTVFFSTRPGSPATVTAPTLNKWYYSGEYLSITRSNLKRMKFHLRQMYSHYTAIVQVAFGLSSSTSSYVPLAVPQGFINLAYTYIWATSSLEWFADVPAGTSVYAIWFNVQYVAGGSNTGNFVVTNDTPQYNQFFAHDA